MSVRDGRRQWPQLRPLHPSDYDYLYHSITVPDGLLAQRLLNGTPSPEDFARFLWSGVFTQFIVESRKQIVGLLVASAFRPKESQVALVYHADSGCDDGMHRAALYAFLQHLVADHEIRKITTTVREDERDQFLARGGQVFEYEGTLRRHEIRHGVPVDVHHYAAFGSRLTAALNGERLARFSNY